VQPERFEFRFKGDRDYVHGTDMFNALVAAHPAASLHDIHFTIHGFVRTSGCDVYRARSREALGDLQDVKVRASFDFAGVMHWLALKESSVPRLAGRYEYREERVTSLCDVRDHTITLRRRSPFTFIETVVAMNKHMHQTVFADAVGKWIFTGIDLAHGCDAREQISLHTGGDVNYRLTRTRIAHRDGVIGNLFFSLIK
jgi:hypothetical protein